MPLPINRDEIKNIQFNFANFGQINTRATSCFQFANLIQNWIRSSGHRYRQLIIKWIFSLVSTMQLRLLWIDITFQHDFIFSLCDSIRFFFKKNNNIGSNK